MKKKTRTEARKIAKDKGLPNLSFIGPGGKTFVGWRYDQKGDHLFPKGEGLDIAKWGLMEKDGQERMTEEAREKRMTAMLKASTGLHYPAVLLMQALMSGDHGLFREVAEAMEFLQKEVIHMGPGGIYEVEALGVGRPQDYIILNWKRWEASRAPVKERLDDMRKGGVGITRETYYRIVKATRLVSDDTPPFDTVSVSQ